MEGEQRKEMIAGLPATLSSLKKQIQASRVAYIKGKLSHNKSKLEASTSQFSALAQSVGNACSTDLVEKNNMLSFRTVNVLCRLGSESGFMDKENVHCQEELSSSTIVFGNGSNGKCAVRPVKLPAVEKIPPYTTWIFLARNQRMADDQSVVGRRQIYYEQNGGETIICSDSEAELAEPEEEKHEFSEGEDQMLWMALHHYGSDSEIIKVLLQFIDATPSEIMERYETLLKQYQSKNNICSGSSEGMESVDLEKESFLDGTLSAALDSFDNIFCRRCFTFDCRLHGCSQGSILPSEKQPYNIELDDIGKPCGDRCYLLRDGTQRSCKVISSSAAICENQHSKDIVVTSVSNSENSNTKDRKSNYNILDRKSTNDWKSTTFASCAVPRTSFSGDATGEMSSHDADASLNSVSRKQTELIPDVLSADVENQMDVDPGPHYDHQPQSKPEVGSSGNPLEMIVSNDVKLHDSENDVVEVEERNLQAPVMVVASGCRGHISWEWKPLEKDLFLKGLEIFGKNSCLIARNLLSGLKTCAEVYKYMFSNRVSVLNRPMLTKSNSEKDFTDTDYMEEMPSRTRTWRRRGKTRRLKYTWKSAVHPSIRKRIADGKEQCKKYVPCGCQQMCGKECPCHQNGTCCEKYCGCLRNCKNRFRGCHCAKSQCRSRQCPCYAAGRECDPDVCRNCWVSCGDGSLGEPPSRGDGYQCGNMKLLLKQQQKILLGRSDVAGWGAFIKNPVNKHDYLGEYTGELISHKEADKRGKIYDRANSSFLFDLNEQYVLDAYRKGDKLKFANHSSNPNCYAKVMLVAGDHRVGIFAKEHIDASEELFYDYRYGPDQAPAWARKPEGSKRDDQSSSHSKRAHKVA